MLTAKEIVCKTPSLPGPPKKKVQIFTCMKIQYETPSETVPEIGFLLPTQHHPKIPFVEIL
jgi:hypothetical protein